MKRASYLIVVVLLGLLFNSPANAQASHSKSIIVEQPWARATPKGAKTGAAYLKLINNGSSEDRLLSAATPVADKVQFHSASEENGVSRMREMDAIKIAPGTMVTFRPGSMHIMMAGLKQPLKEGQTFPMTLTFEKAGKIDLMVPIAKVGAMKN